MSTLNTPPLTFHLCLPILLLSVSLALDAPAFAPPEWDPSLAAFRILPYLQEPSSTGMRINWFTKPTLIGRCSGL